MARTCALVLILLASAPSLRAADDDVSWTDKFTKQQLDEYQIEGDVAWNQRLGGIRLNPRAFVARSAAMGFTAEVRADVWLPEGLGPKRGLNITVREGPAMNYTTTFLGIHEGRPILAVMEFPLAPLPLKPAAGDEAGEGPWVLRLRLRYGVVQAKAWPKSQTEPAEWQVTGYSGDPGWEPRMVAVHSGDGAGLLQRLQVRGERPATDLFLKPDLSDETDNVIQLMRKTVSLRLQGNIVEALPTANEALAAARTVFGDEHAVTATCLHNAGAVHHDAGNYKESLRYFQSALKIRRKVLPPDHPQIAQNLDGVGAALAALSRLEDAKSNYAAALELRRKTLGDDHPDTAYGWNNLGQSQSLLADYPAAMESFRNSLSIRQALYGEKHPDVAKAHNNLGYQLFAMGRYLEALPELERALEIYRKILGDDHPDTALAENNLGFLLKAMGRFGPALERLENAVRIYTLRGGPRHVLRAAALGNKALVHAEIGEFAAARSLFEEALSIRREVLGDDHPDTALMQVNLAATAAFTGDAPTMLKLLNEAVKVLVAKLPPEHPTLALVLNNLAVLSDDNPDPETHAFMLDALQAALTINRKKLGEHHPETLNVQNSLAKVLTDLGRADDAEQLLAASLASCQAQLGDGHPLTALLRHNLGSVYYRRARLPQAEAELIKAAASFRKSYGPRHPQTAVTLNLLATTVGAAGRHDEALAYAAESAAAYSDIARRILAGTAEAQHSQLLLRWWPEVRLFTAIAAADPARLGDRADDLFDIVMNWKSASGRAMLDRLEALAVEKSAESKAYQEVLGYRRQIVLESIRGAGTDTIESYNARLASLQERMDALERDLSRRVADYAAVAKVREAGVAEIARHLPPKAALVEFVYQPEVVSMPGPAISGVTDREFYVALVLYREPGRKEVAVKLVPLPPAEEIDAVIQKWRSETRSGRTNSITDAELREKLWQPVAAHLPADVDRLLLAPDGQIALIPFEAVRLADDRYLVEKYRVGYVTTGRDLVPRPAARDALGPPLILSDPTYDLAGFSGKPIRAAAQVSPQSFAFASNPRKQKPLPGFDVEAKAIVEMLASKSPAASVRLMEHDDATEDGAATVARPRLLYFITHGGYMIDPRRAQMFDAPPPPPRDMLPKPGETPLVTLGEFGADPRLRSILFLAGCNHWRERAAAGLSDGLLTALEVQSLDLWGTDLVVASACDTGLGEVRVGEGVLGLRRAFQQAGARTVVSSLWKVPDEQTKVLMPRFLELWLAGTPKADALRQSQLELIKTLRASPNPDHRPASPFYWAAFVCHGLPQ